MLKTGQTLVLIWTLMCWLVVDEASANPDAKRLLEALMTGYNKLVRPVVRDDEILQVKFKVKLAQLLDLQEKDEILVTNLWLKQVWSDYSLTWDPSEYGDVDSLYIPADMIWLPNIVLYNNADGQYEVTIMPKATVYWNGTVVWEPPCVYKSMCQINVEFFPFDEQVCELKFGSWTYSGFEVDLLHYDDANVTEELVNNRTVWHIASGMDVSEFMPSVEWDIMSIPAERHEERFPCCREPYIDITYYLNLRRKTLFYTINLIIPCFGISFLTILVFYLPSNCGEKVVLCLFILISLTVFFLLLVEIMPSTSLSMPLIGKYLIFTLVMVTCSCVVTVITLNYHFRTPDTHTMPDWIKNLFLECLPKWLLMRRLKTVGPEYDFRRMSAYSLATSRSQSRSSDAMRRVSREPGTEALQTEHPGIRPDQNVLINALRPDNLLATATRKAPETMAELIARVARRCTCFIADHFKKIDDDGDIKQDWRYVASVLDRLFLWVFTTVFMGGTFGIVFVAPVFYDKRVPLIS